MIKNHYLRNIRNELLQDDEEIDAPQINDIVYIKAKLEGVDADIMFDTGSNISLINQVELDRLEKKIRRTIPTLPITNVKFIGATGRQNNTVKKQVMLELGQDKVVIPIVLLVANNLPFNVLIGCDILRRYSTIIDLHSGRVTLFEEENVFTAEIIGSQRAPQTDKIIMNVMIDDRSDLEENFNQHSRDIWQEKLNEIREYQPTESNTTFTLLEKEKLVDIYQRY